ncbi:MAG: hypothetical protein R3228_04150 [Halioglobus sp.]|nr:hypothetical protein [Halioglobus sp.]
MKSLTRIVLVIAAVSLASFSSWALAGDEGLTDLQNAKVAYQIAKQRQLETLKSKEEREQDASRQDPSCGSIDIGNVQNERGARAPREVITVVRGDVINTGRCR